MSCRSSGKSACGRPQPADRAEGKKASRTNPSKKTATSSAALVDAGTQTETRRGFVNPPKDQCSAASRVRSESKPLLTLHVSPTRGASCPLPRQSSLPTSESSSRYSRACQGYDQGKHHREAEQPRSHSFHWHPIVRANIQ